MDGEKPCVVPKCTRLRIASTEAGEKGILKSSAKTEDAHEIRVKKNKMKNFLYMHENIPRRFIQD